VVLTRVTLTGNEAGNGGGVAATILTADELTVTGNTCDIGAVEVVQPPEAGPWR
jgi:hypothetical protein